jgi:hypothetical protein
MYLHQPFIGADILLEQYWHTLYFDNRIEAAEAQKLIKQTFDEYCDLRPASNRYRVTFCTTYLFDAAHQLCLSMIIGDMAIGYSFNQPEEPEESNGARIRVTHGLCIHCGMQPRASYGLWCVACKLEHRKRVRPKSKASSTDRLPESDPCSWQTFLAELANKKIQVGWYDDEGKYLSIGEIARILLGCSVVPVALYWLALAWFSPGMAVLLSMIVGAIVYWFYEE